MGELDRYFGLEGKTALIVGATGGIGTEISRAFAAAGAILVLSSNDETACNTLAHELGATSRPADMRHTAELDLLVEAAGAIDVLICNAGISGHFGPLGGATDEDRSEIFDINLNAALHLTG